MAPPTRTDLLAALAAAQREGDVLALHLPQLLGAFAPPDGAPGWVTSALGDPAELAAERAALHPARERAVARREGAVAVIPVRGMITHRRSLMELFGMSTSTETLSRQVAEAGRDEGVKAIVLDINSPGGTVPGVDQLAEQILALRSEKTIVAQVNGMAASAAYWIASAAEEIAAPEGSYTGSIGVLSMHIDMSQMAENEGVKVSLISSTPDKIEESPWQPLSEEARAHLQSRVDYFDRLFVESVAKGRGTTAAKIRGLEGRARVYPGGRAKELGLVDKLRGMTETLAALGVDAMAPASGRDRDSALARRRRELTQLSL